MHTIIPTTTAAMIPPTLEDEFLLPVCRFVSLACPVLVVVDGINGVTLEDVAKSIVVDSEVDKIVLVITEDTAVSDTVSDDVNIVLDVVEIPKSKLKIENYQLFKVQSLK